MGFISTIFFNFVKKIVFFLIVTFIFHLNLSAQELLPVKKISSVFLQKVQKNPVGQKFKIVLAVVGEKMPANFSLPGFKKIKSFGNMSFFEGSCTIDELNKRVIPISEIIFIEDGARIPKEEAQISNLDLSQNKINKVHSSFPLLNGDGLTVSVKENKPDTADIDFKGRYLTTNLSSNQVSSHATNMSTLIGGAGNTWHLGKGAAWGSRISSSNFASLLPDAPASYLQYNISVQNHSYGVGVENYYGADAAAYDLTALNDPSLSHVFSSGNSGTTTGTSGTYLGIPGFANLTGSFKMAKNILTVGATDSFGVVANLSSKGPAYDGRIKPELVAFGEDGSSGAAALVSGVSLILQQQYKQLNGSLPSSALIRAVLLNSADDVGTDGIDFSSGFGSLNAFKAVNTILSGRTLSGSVMNTTEQLFSISVPAGIKKFKVTLVWNDPPAAPNAPGALVNDLDLELINVSTLENWKPWVLNSFPHIDSLNELPTRKRDSLNNAEQVSLDNPASGTYQFKVIGKNVTTTSQSFYIAYQFDSTDIFEWNFPTDKDFLFSSTTNTLRWTSSFNSAPGKLEFSINNGQSWQLINNAVDLSTGYYKWQAPVTISEVIFKMTIDNNLFITDKVTIAQRTFTGVGFNCSDSFLIFWKKIPGVNSYRVYKLGDKYLEPLFVTTDSFSVLAKNANPTLHYAVAPMIGNNEAVKSYTFNYTTQGVECYIRSFLTSLQNNTVELILSLGTLYNINKIIFEKYDGKDFKSIHQLASINNLQANFTDVTLTKGLNIYRIKIELAGGRSIYSSSETVYYFSGTEYIIYPNPVLQYQPITILSEDAFPTVTLQVLNGLGQLMFTKQIDDVVTTIPSGKLSKGIYYFRFIKKDVKDNVMKVMIQ